MTSFAKKSVLNRLQGVCCVYKPPGVSLNYVLHSFRFKLCKDLNEKYNWDPYPYLKITKGGTESRVDLRPSYEDHQLVTGPKYTFEDLSVVPYRMGSKASGVVPIGINFGIKDLINLRRCNPLRVYQVKGKLGEATQFLYKDQRVVAKAKVRISHRSTMEKILSSFQAIHQRKAFLSMGINMQSQEAYELAVQGMVRPNSKDVPYFYSMKCVEFQRPNFTLELTCINESEDYILRFICEIGLKLRTVAHCTGLRIIRCGPFTVKDSLLLEECNVENVESNINHCKPLLQHVLDNFKDTTHLAPLTDKISETMKK